jgi:hypothetical protein
LEHRRERESRVSHDNDWLISSFGDIYPAHVTAFVDLLLVLRQEFEGDLDMMLILAIIGDRRIWQRACKEDVSYAGLGKTPLPLEASDAISINVLSIANFTSIPRETVRRKVAALIERGWVDREDNGDLCPTRKAAIDLQVGTDATIAYVRAIVEACDRARSSDHGTGGSRRTGA